LLIAIAATLPTVTLRCLGAVFDFELTNQACAKLSPEREFENSDGQSDIYQFSIFYCAHYIQNGVLEKAIFFSHLIF
jgi:hypothetical protein